jgi:hypothetical protein
LSISKTATPSIFLRLHTQEQGRGQAQANSSGPQAMR